MASQAKTDVMVPRERRENQVGIKLFSLCVKYFGFNYVYVCAHVHLDVDVGGAQKKGLGPLELDLQELVHRVGAGRQARALRESS